MGADLHQARVQRRTANPTGGLPSSEQTEVSGPRGKFGMSKRWGALEWQWVGTEDASRPLQAASRYIRHLQHLSAALAVFAYADAGYRFQIPVFIANSALEPSLPSGKRMYPKILALLWGMTECMVYEASGYVYAWMYMHTCAHLDSERPHDARALPGALAAGCRPHGGLRPGRRRRGSRDLLAPHVLSPLVCLRWGCLRC